MSGGSASKQIEEIESAGEVHLNRNTREKITFRQQAIFQILDKFTTVGITIIVLKKYYCLFEEIRN
mgnify:CR=1 FL=1